MTTGPDDQHGTPGPGVPPSSQPYGAPPPPPYQGYPQQGFDQQMQQQYGAPYGQQPYPPNVYGQPYQAPPPNDGMALAAMIVGIVSIVLTCGYGIGLLGSPVALGLGLAAKRRIDRSQGQLGGRGFAQAGFVLGIVGTVLLVLAIALIVGLIIASVNGAFDDSGNTTF